jgi:phage tail protein X
MIVWDILRWRRRFLTENTRQWQAYFAVNQGLAGANPALRSSRKITQPTDIQIVTHSCVIRSQSPN